MRNTHERHIAAPAERVGEVLETLATDQDQLWPGETWAPMRLDRGLEPGSRGGHAGIRYKVTVHDVGRLVAFAFDRTTGIDGTHTLTVVDLGDDTALLRHELEGRARGGMVLLWPLAVRWAHDALVEDAFDRAEAALGVGPATPAQWRPWVRLLRKALPAASGRPDVHQIETPAALCEAAGLSRVDFTDTFVLRLPPGSSRDVELWHRALLTAGSPAWVDTLFGVRNLVAQGLGLDTAGGSSDTSPFTALTRAGDILVVGADDKHLDFRGVLRVAGDDLQCTTVVQEHNLLGRAYFAVVQPFHRLIVPALLRRVARRAPTPAWPARPGRRRRCAGRGVADRRRCVGRLGVVLGAERGEELHADPVDAAQVVGEDDRADAGCGDEPGEGAEAAGAAVVPEHDPAPWRRHP
jgi:hypothetical protein